MRRRTTLLLLALLASLVGYGQGRTYRNPVINADVPDMSVCKVADTYYMVSTTMHLMPGCPVMASEDMVEWRTVGYVFDRIDDGDRYSLIDGQTAYGQGQWASSIRYHMGRFYVWFTANGAPGRGFVFSAERPEGPWTLVSRPPHMHDGSLFFDEDGRVYMFTGSGQCRVVEMRPDLTDVLRGGLDTVVVSDDPDERGGLLEGSSVFKHDGYYYLCMISMNWHVQGRLRREVCYRSRRIEGPYEKHVILETPFERYGGVGQGCLVGDDQSDQGWQALIFQDRGGIGRVPCLMPVTWVEGWPMCGEYKAGAPETTEARLDPRNYQIPNDLSKAHPSVEGLIGSDEFDKTYTSTNTGKPSLGLLWQWNHNPIDGAWSLTERPGFLRLTTARVVDNLNVAPNTLTQRMAAPQSTGTVCLDVSGMRDGDVCGLAAFNGDSGVLRIVRRGGKWVLELTEEKSVFGDSHRVERVDVEVLASVVLNRQKDFSPRAVYLRLHGDFDEGRDLASFAYSLDGQQWTPFEPTVKMRFDYRRHFMGTKFALFNYATKRAGGHVDFDWFRISDPVRPLREAFADKFLMGAALNTRDVEHGSDEALRVITRNFNSIVAENCMKAGELTPAEGVYRFAHADRFVDFGTEHGMAVIGHCLVWHSQAPAWFFTDGQGQPVSREVLIERMRHHIHTVVGRYRGRVKGWDVVNEAIEDDGSLRHSPYYNIIGEDYLELAFRFAHEADPDAELYYNDYSMDGRHKREAVCRLVRRLKAAGCRIDAVGMQSHVSFDTNLAEYEKSIEAFVAEGVRVCVTELDLSVLPWPRRGMGAGVEQNYDYARTIDPYPDGLPDSVAARQTDFMSRLFDIYLRHSADIERVTFWGVSDGDSWKNNWPVHGRTDYPLAFDRQYRPKPFVRRIVEKATTTSFP